MYNPLEIIFSFPRLYLTLYLFGREFSLSAGWFRADIQEDWKFRPELTLLRKLSAPKSPLSPGFVMYVSEIGFCAFQHQLALSLDMTKHG